MRSARRLTIGRGLDNCDLGPLASHDQHVKTSYIDAAAMARASCCLAAAGRRSRPRLLRRAHRFDEVDPSSVTAREEIFGPVAVALPFDTSDQAMAMANRLGFGLVAGVYAGYFPCPRLRPRCRGLARSGSMAGSSAASGATGGIRTGLGARGLPGIHNYLNIKNIDRLSRFRQSQKRNVGMTHLKDIEHFTIFQDPQHCVTSRHAGPGMAT